MTRVPHFDRAAMQRLRLEQGLTRAKLGLLAFGRTHRGNSITSYECGYVMPTIQTVNALCAVLGCGYDELVPAVTPAPIIKPPAYTGKAGTAYALDYTERTGRARVKEWHPSWRFD